MEDRKSIWEELTVIEIASVLAGPAVGMFFSEMGSKVIKIENPGSNGDVTRSWKLEGEDPESGTSAYFASVNWNKEFRNIDLRTEDGLEEVLSLIEKADILITNFKSGGAEKLGLGKDVLKERNPRLIHGHIGGFTTDSSRIAYDVILQAETGFMSMTGHEACGPAKMPVALIDLLAAHQLKEGILTSLLERERTGKGAIVETTLEEAAISSLANQASNFLMTGHIAVRMGSLHPNIAPYGEVFKTRDGIEIVIGVGNNAQFQALTRVLQCQELIEDERFRSNPKRVENRKALRDLLEPGFTKKDGKELLKDLQKSGVPAGKVKDLQEVLESRAARDMILEEKQNRRRTQRVRTVSFHRYES